MKNTFLGISVYPEQQPVDEIIEYIKLAKKYSFSRLFTSLLQVTEENKEEALGKMKKVCQFAKELDFDVILDVSPRIFNVLGISLPDVSLFEELGATTIRLDNHYDGYTEKKISQQSNLNLEVNMSSLKSLGSMLDELQVDKTRVVASHNFYPQRLTGLSWEYFEENTKHYKDLGFRTSAFVTSQSEKATWGPWPINEGLCTLEEHRDLPLVTQAKHLLFSGLVDDIIIGNAYASEEELKALSEIDPNSIELQVELKKELNEVERKILVDYNQHFRRGDINEYVIRSTMTRVIYKENDIPQFTENLNTKQSLGEIYIGNNEFKNYKGELHLIINDMPRDEKKNFVAEVINEEKFLIKYINSWKSFKLKIKE